MKSDLVNQEAYPIGKVLTLEDVQEKYGEDSIAYANIVNNGYEYALQTECGWLQHLMTKDLDRVIDPSTIEYAKENEDEDEDENDELGSVDNN